MEITAEDAEVAVGQLRVRTKLNELEYRKPEVKKERKTNRERLDPLPELGESPGLELDLRGARVEDALKRTEDYLHAAYMARLPFVRIIHGKGTGALRRAVRETLQHNTFVAKFADGSEKEGGYGVTVVNLIEQY
ncbi:MAG: hypothetical protein HC915_08090 [Anaerolineae bacterium]|nr:hypothetical protein [Anaerolineae bacterium]